MREQLIVVGSTAHSLINFRYDLILKLSKYYSVTAVSKDYDTNVKKKLYLINNKSLYQKEDIIKKMYKDLITNKKKFKSNKLKSLFIIKMIEKIKNKIL